MNVLTSHSGGEAHVEMFAQSTTGLPIFISCTCDIGHTHTYGEWLEHFQELAYRNSPRTADTGSTIRRALPSARRDR